MSEDKLILAIPSKGRLMDKSRDIFASAGLVLRKTGDERGYRGIIDGIDSIEIAYLSAMEIAAQLKVGRVHMGITGEDLLRETIGDVDSTLQFMHPLGFGNADVVVAVPGSWLDVSTMGDLEDVAARFHLHHGRRLKVATKYMNITRRFFSQNGVSSYRIVGSLGATEGTPAAGTAEVIVDITSTGQTLKANHLKILDDGIIFQSQANLAASEKIEWSKTAFETRDQILNRLNLSAD